MSRALTFLTTARKYQLGDLVPVDNDSGRRTRFLRWILAGSNTKKSTVGNGASRLETSATVAGLHRGDRLRLALQALGPV